MLEGSRKVEKRSSGDASWPEQRQETNKRKSILLIPEKITIISAVSESCWCLGQLGETQFIWKCPRLGWLPGRRDGTQLFYIQFKM